MKKILVIGVLCVVSFVAGRYSVTPETVVEVVRLGSLLTEEDLPMHDTYGVYNAAIDPKEFGESGERSIQRVGLPAFAWVTVQVEDGPLHKVGETCSVSEKGAVTSTKFSYQNSILVFYLAPKDEQGGAQCEDGTFFLMDRTTFDLLKRNNLLR